MNKFLNLSCVLGRRRTFLWWLLPQLTRGVITKVSITYAICFWEKIYVTNLYFSGIALFLGNTGFRAFSMKGCFGYNRAGSLSMGQSDAQNLLASAFVRCCVHATRL
jgi:hypothetical protein